VSSPHDALFKQVFGNTDHARGALPRDILLVNEHVEPDALQALLERAVGPEAKDTIMTAGERLIQQGERQGLERGERQGERRLLLRQLRRRFDQAVDGAVEQRVVTASPEQIEIWAERVLSAMTLDELLAD
jgi:predicted transposase YdaD